MAVPCGDQRDYDFAKHFNIPIPNIFENVDISEAAHADKEGTVIANSDFLSGLKYKKALKLAIYEILGQKPDLLVSGINHGSNASINVIYSGTMSAAVEGAVEGIP